MPGVGASDGAAFMVGMNGVTLAIIPVLAVTVGTAAKAATNRVAIVVKDVRIYGCNAVKDVRICGCNAARAGRICSSNVAKDDKSSGVMAGSNCSGRACSNGKSLPQTEDSAEPLAPGLVTAAAVAALKVGRAGAAARPA